MINYVIAIDKVQMIICFNPEINTQRIKILIQENTDV